MTFETLSMWVQQGGTIYFVMIFVAVLIYALWPRNRTRFDAAARIPLDEED